VIHQWREAFQRPQGGGAPPSDLNRGPAFESIIRDSWNVTTAPSVEFVPTQPIVCLALGFLDTAGIVKIISDEFPGKNYRYVSARAPLAHRLTKKFRFAPAFAVATAVPVLATLHLDLYYEPPTQRVLRGAMWIAGTLDTSATQPPTVDLGGWQIQTTQIPITAIVRTSFAPRNSSRTCASSSVKEACLT